MIFLPNIHIHEALAYGKEVNQGQIITLKNENKNENSINDLLHTLMTEFHWGKTYYW
jgi:hypothetical protein